MRADHDFERLKHLSASRKNNDKAHEHDNNAKMPEQHSTGEKVKSVARYVATDAVKKLQKKVCKK